MHMRNLEEASSTGDSEAPSSGDLWDTDRVFGQSLPELSDPFALLSSAACSTTTSQPDAGADAPVDVLEQLKREAEAALRDPNYVSEYWSPVAAPVEPEATQSALDPLHSLVTAGHCHSSLLELLEGSASINRLTDPIESLESHELFSVERAPDVLRLFAGDIVSIRPQDVAAPLARREHHLVSMDSAYRLAHAEGAELGK